jgi:tRNA A-37 threonylcarbamoyl transferase component Bud32
MHLLCPHCQSLIELVRLDAAQEVVCPACGSTFRLEQGSTAPWPPGDGHRMLGRFELIGTVGTGAFGTVYKARDPRLDRTVAIKVPRAGNLPADEDRDRFRREARSVAQLSHPAIVPVHEVGEHEGLPFLVSEFVEGVTLSDLLTAHRPAPREAARLVAAVAEALQYAHEHGIVHRDIKPSNILLDAQGQPHVMDVGLAKREAGEVTMTLDGQVLGTPAYMSPEQARGESHRVDGRSDIYSLGVILYQLLAGELPFRGNSRMLLHQVLHDEPRPPRSLNDRIPRDLETVCLKAMAKEPSRRYPSARDLAEDLGRFLSEQPVRARPVGRTERLWRWCRRNPSLAGVSALAAAALVAASLIAIEFAIQQALAAKTERGLRINVSEAYDRVKSERDKADEARREAERLASDIAFERGRSLSEQGHVPQGLLWMARALELAPSDNAALQQPIRANLAAWRDEVRPLKAILPGGVIRFQP